MNCLDMMLLRLKNLVRSKFKNQTSKSKDQNSGLAAGGSLKRSLGMEPSRSHPAWAGCHANRPQTWMASFAVDLPPFAVLCHFPACAGKAQLRFLFTHLRQTQRRRPSSAMRKS
jgi:hypothetical protein